LDDLPEGVAWSACVRDAASGEVLAARDAGRALSAASLGKLLLLVEAARAIEEGDLDPAEPLTRTGEDAVADSGVWQDLGVAALPAADVAALVGAFSDNLATNILLRRLGLDAVAGTARALGLQRTALHDRVRDVRGPGDPARLSSAAAGELTDLLAAVHEGRVAGSGLVRGWLARNADLSLVPAALGLDPLAHVQPDRGLRLRNKTGADAGVRGDAGWLEGPGGALTYALIANWDEAADRRDDVLAAMARAGRRLAEAVG
jgi:beta-lactamase class A